MIYLIAFMVFIIMICAIVTAWFAYRTADDIAMMRLTRK